MKAERRLGGIPPIVTVLITISAVVAASLVAWFMWSSTRAATLQPVLEVTSAYVSGSGTTYAVSFIIRNVGAAQISSVALDEISCETTPGGSVVAGTPASCTFSTTTQTASCRATFTSSISDGSTCYARVRASHTGSTGTTTSAITLTFKVAKP
jgi:uncharacterized protein (TIGR02588 family)